MSNRKGILLFASIVLLWMLPLSAEETAEDVVAMLDWWEEYGRYWDEVGAVGFSEDEEEMAFASLNGVVDIVEREVP